MLQELAKGHIRQTEIILSPLKGSSIPGMITFSWKCYSLLAFPFSSFPLAFPLRHSITKGHLKPRANLPKGKVVEGQTVGWGWPTSKIRYLL